MWVVDIQVRHCDDEEAAISKAKELIKRKYYILRSVVECDCAIHSAQHTRSLEATRELTKIMKKQFPDGND